MIEAESYRVQESDNIAAVRQKLQANGLAIGSSFDLSRSISAPSVVQSHRRSLLANPHHHVGSGINNDAADLTTSPLTSVAINGGNQPVLSDEYNIDDMSNATDDDQPIPLPNSRDKFDIWYLTICFFLLFTGYALCQSFVAAREPDYGLYSLALVYGSFATIGGIIGPSVVYYIGARGGLVLASLMYVAWMLVFAANYESPRPALFLASSALLGPSAGILWASQALHMSKLVARTGSGSAGYFTSIFFTVHGLNILLSHSIAVPVLSLSDVSSPTFTWIMAGGLGGAGAVGLWFVRAVDVPASAMSVTQEPSIGVRIRQLWGSHKDTRTQLLLPAFIMQGLSFAFAIGPFAARAFLVRDTHVPSISLSFLCYGGVSSLFTRLWPRLYDSSACGPRGLLAALALFLIAPYALYIITLDKEWGVWSYMIICGLLGGADALMACLTNMAIVISYRKQEATHAFTAYRMWCALATACGLVFAKLTSTLALQITVGAFLVIAIICHVVLQLHLRRRVGGQQYGTRIRMERKSVVGDRNKGALDSDTAPLINGNGTSDSSNGRYVPPTIPVATPVATTPAPAAAATVNESKTTTPLTAAGTSAVSSGSGASGGSGSNHSSNASTNRGSDRSLGRSGSLRSISAPSAAPSSLPAASSLLSVGIPAHVAPVDQFTITVPPIVVSAATAQPTNNTTAADREAQAIIEASLRQQQTADAEREAQKRRDAEQAERQRQQQAAAAAAVAAAAAEAEALRVAQEQQAAAKVAEQQRLAAAEAARIEAERVAAVAAKAESDRQAAAAAKAEATRIEAARVAAEEQRLALAKKAEAEEQERQRVAAIEAENVRRQQEQQAAAAAAAAMAAAAAAKAEAERQEAERVAKAKADAEAAERQRQQAEAAAAAEAARVQAERLAEEQRLVAAQAEAMRQEQERRQREAEAQEAARQEAKRIAEEHRRHAAAAIIAAQAEAQRLAAQEAERERQLAAAAAEAARIALEAERVAAAQAAAAAEAERIAREEEAERVKREDAERREAARVEELRLQLEAQQRQAAEMVRIQQEMEAERHAAAMAAEAARAAAAAAEEAARLAEQQRQAEDEERRRRDEEEMAAARVAAEAASEAARIAVAHAASVATAVVSDDNFFDAPPSSVLPSSSFLPTHGGALHDATTDDFDSRMRAPSLPGSSFTAPSFDDEPLSSNDDAERRQLEAEEQARAQAEAAAIAAEAEAQRAAEQAQLEADRLAKEEDEQRRHAEEMAHQARAAALEAERIAAEQQHAAEMERQRHEAEQQAMAAAAAKAEAERIAAERAAMIEAQRAAAEAERIAMEQERQRLQQAEAARLAAEHEAATAAAAAAEAQRIAEEQRRHAAEQAAERERQQREQEAAAAAAAAAEAQRLAEEQRTAAAKAEAERQEQERRQREAEAEAAAAAAAQEAARIEAERIAAQQAAERERQQREAEAAAAAAAAKAEAERQEAERVAKAKADAEAAAAAAAAEAARIAEEQRQQQAAAAAEAAAKAEAERVAKEAADRAAHEAAVAAEAAAKAAADAVAAAAAEAKRAEEAKLPKSVYPVSPTGNWGENKVHPYQDISGVWQVVVSKEDTAGLDNLLSELGIGWMTRKVITNLTVITTIVLTPTKYVITDATKLGPPVPSEFTLDGQERMMKDASGKENKVKAIANYGVNVWAYPSPGVMTYEERFLESRTVYRQTIEVIKNGKRTFRLERRFTRTETDAERAQAEKRWAEYGLDLRANCMALRNQQLQMDHAANGGASPAKK